MDEKRSLRTPSPTPDGGGGGPRARRRAARPAQLVSDAPTINERHKLIRASQVLPTVVGATAAAAANQPASQPAESVVRSSAAETFADAVHRRPRIIFILFI